MNKRIVAAMLVMLLVGTLGLADEKKDKPLTPADQVKVARAVADSLVRVEYTLQFDKGQAPGGGWYGAAETIRQERPMETAGLLLTPTKVITRDVVVHPRFIKSVAVRFGGHVVKAETAAYAKGHDVMFLELSEPLKGAKPLTFDAAGKGPYLTVDYARCDATWTISVSPLTTSVSITETNRRYREAPRRCLIVDKTGAAVGVSTDDEMPIDDSWKGSPLNWPTVTAAEMKKRLTGLEDAADRALPRVTLNFRSPRKTGRQMYFNRGGDESKTEHNTTGILIDAKRILVLARLSPKVTARLERITVHPPGGQAVAAKFAHTLKDYGCLVATLERPLPGAITFSPADTRKYRNRLLLSARIIVQGQKRTAYFGHDRITSHEIGWKQQIYPDVRGHGSNTFFFDSDGALLALPVARRQKVSVQERWRSDSAMLTAGAYLKGVLGNLADNVDTANVPLTEEHENRLAWMGLELQGLNKELARANNVSDLTRDGQTGALVSYVYPDSPAAKAGIEPGYILLRVHAADQPKPIEVQIESRFGGRAFPWDRWDELPEQMFDNIPTPWPSRENTLTRALTDLGFGKKYQAEFFCDGKVVRKDFEVVVSPPHYGTAAKHKSETLGMTVRDLTYELRRYFQKKPDDPGVIASKIKPGSKASVSGLKPYEIITHIDGKPVNNVKDFEKLTKGRTELRLSVKRMTRGRIVKIKLTPKPETTTKPAPPAPG